MIKKNDKKTPKRFSDLIAQLSENRCNSPFSYKNSSFNNTCFGVELLNNSSYKTLKVIIKKQETLRQHKGL